MPFGPSKRYSGAMDWLFALVTVLIAASLGTASLHGAEDVDKETEKALEAAAENAKRMGIKMPDLKSFMEDDEKKESATEAAKESVTPKAAKPSGVLSLPDWTPPTPPIYASRSSRKKDH